MDTKFKARFFDGKKIQERAAWVLPLTDGLKVIYVDNQTEQEYLWPKETLQLLERPYQNKPAVVGCKSMLGARLIIENTKDYESILPLISKKNIKLSHIHHPWRVTWLIIACIAIIIFLFTTRSHMLSLWIANIIPYRWEESLWENEVKPYVSNDAKECVDPQGKKALNKLIAKLDGKTNSKHKFDVRVIDSPQFINAESLPGFHILIYSGILGMNSADSLAGVIAHEMGHSLKHHVIAIFISEMGIKTFLGAIFGLSKKNVALIFLNQKYKRDFEAQADDIGVQLLKDANVNPASFREALAYLLKNSHEHEGLEAYLVDHPPFKERIANIPSDAATSQWEPILTDTEWNALKSICNKKIPLKYE